MKKTKKEVEERILDQFKSEKRLRGLMREDDDNSLREIDNRCKELSDKEQKILSTSAPFSTSDNETLTAIDQEKEKLDQKKRFIYEKYGYASPIDTHLPLEDLVEIELFDEIMKSVEFIETDKEGHIHIKINPTATRERIHYLIDDILDSKYTETVDTRFYKGKVEALEDGRKIFEEKSKGKSLLQIAKERCGIDENPAYDKTVKAEYEKVKRYFRQYKDEIINKKELF